MISMFSNIELPRSWTETVTGASYGTGTETGKGGTTAQRNIKAFYVILNTYLNFVISFSASA